MGSTFLALWNFDSPGPNHFQALRPPHDFPGHEHRLAKNQSVETKGKIHAPARGGESPRVFGRYMSSQNRVKLKCYAAVMRSSRKGPESNKRTATAHRSESSVGADSSAEAVQLKKIAKFMGNAHVGASLSGSTMHRNTLLAHVCERLAVLERAQAKERLSMSKEREWFKGVAKGADGHHLPDLTRWHESARLYKRAGEALSHGNLGRGAQLIQQAEAAEQAAFDSVPVFVAETLTEHEAAAAAPEQAHFINDEAACAGCAPPTGLKVADAILSISDKMDAAPPLPKRTPRWFEEVLDEEETDDDE